jgi:hypothetical protein
MIMRYPLLPKRSLVLVAAVFALAQASYPKPLPQVTPGMIAEAIINAKSTEEAKDIALSSPTLLKNDTMDNLIFNLETLKEKASVKSFFGTDREAIEMSDRLLNAFKERAYLVDPEELG